MEWNVEMIYLKVLLLEGWCQVTREQGHGKEPHDSDGLWQIKELLLFGELAYLGAAEDSVLETAYGVNCVDICLDLAGDQADVLS